MKPVGCNVSQNLHALQYIALRVILEPRGVTPAWKGAVGQAAGSAGALDSDESGIFRNSGS